MIKTIFVLVTAILLQIPLHQSDRPKTVPDGGSTVRFDYKNLKPLKPLVSPALATISQVAPIEVAASAPQVSNAVSYNVGGSHEDWMAAAGISASDYQYVDYIVSHESGWRINAYNPSGAYGLCQSLPASKMAIFGSDYESNPVTQLKWCNSYAIGKGGWYASYLFWVANRWW
jgi:soluble lytic murein transglycosylase-like protein